MADLVIPAKLAAAVVEWEGDRGRAWLRDLPELVQDVRSEWDLELGPPFDPGGQISWVAPALRRTDGLDAVLKVQLPHPESEPEADGLVAWGGNGAVLLHDHDPARHALLVERCDPGTSLLALGGSDEAMQIGAALGARLHRVSPPPRAVPLATVLEDWADALEARLKQRYIDPALERLVLDTMRLRATAAIGPVLLHGDLNPSNVLAARREPWLAIDPKPMLGDPAYDGPRLVTQPSPLITPQPATALARRLDIVSDTMGVDRGRLVMWCLVGAVEMGSAARSHGNHESAAEHLDLVSLVAAELP